METCYESKIVPPDDLAHARFCAKVVYFSIRRNFLLPAALFSEAQRSVFAAVYFAAEVLV